MTDAGDAVETSGWFCVLALTHAPMMIFLLYAALTVFERALGSKRGRTRETMPRQGGRRPRRLRANTHV